MSTPEAPQRFDNARYREVMGHYPTGVVVVTARTEEVGPVGMVVGTFTSVSLEPPLIAFLPRTESGTYALMREASAYCVNVLAHDQQDVCRTMATPGPGAFDRVAWHESPWGAPMLDGVVAHIHCRPIEEVTRGDHHIVLCEVDDMAVLRAVTPLLFFQGGYGGFSPHGLSARGDADVISALRDADLARPTAERLAREFRCEASVLAAVTPTEMTTAISAHGGDSTVTERLGERVPLVPPLGDVTMAWASDADVDAWVSRSVSRDPAVHERYRQRLGEIRRRGHSLWLIDPEHRAAHEEIVAAIREYGAGELVPARERALRERIQALAPALESARLEPGQLHDVASIVAPVHAPDGTAPMTLRLTQLPPGASAEQVQVWIDELTRSAGEVSRLLTGAEAGP